MWAVLADDGFGGSPIVLALCDSEDDARDTAESYGSCGEYVRVWVDWY